MTTTLFKEVNYSLAKLVEDIDMGEIGLPELQRPFVWPNAKVRDLFDSMYRGFPVGYLLFWVNGTEDGHRQIGPDGKQKTARLLIVDGQQRLTSLFAVLKGLPVVRQNYSPEYLYIAFCPRDQSFQVADAAIRRDPEYIPDISVMWAAGTDMFELAETHLRALEAAGHAVSPEERRTMRQAISNLHNLQHYPFTALELSAAVNEEQVAEVFVRINSQGKILNQADFILTLMSVFWEAGRAELEAFCRHARHPSTSGPSPFNHFIIPAPDQLLRVGVGLGFRRARLQYVYSILRGKDLDTEQFSTEHREHQFAILQQAQADVLNLQNWHAFFNVLLRAGYRSADMITSRMGLVYTYTLFLIGKRDFHIDHYRLRNSMARWYFMTALTGRYTNSPETKMEQDLVQLRALHDAAAFIQWLDRIIADTLTDDYWHITLPNELATSSPRSPSLFAYYAALNLLEARVLFSQLKVSELLDPTRQGKKAALERHHLFPKNYLMKLGITEQHMTNQIANYALVEWADNIAISDKAPAEYFPLYAQRYSEDTLQSMRYWHALPETWEQMEFESFLQARRQAMAEVIHDGFLCLQAA